MRYRAGFALLLLMLPGVTLGQHLKRTAQPKAPEQKRDMLTLRYKPQAGTLLYNIKTDITQHVRDENNELRGKVRTSAQLAIHNVNIDYAHGGTWVFDRYFTNFQITGEDLRGNPLNIREPGVVNKITRFTYTMTGDLTKREVIDPILLLNADAQTYAYFIRPPTLLAPLPRKLVTYGDTWTEQTQDTIPVRDTINIGVTQGRYIYSIERVYRLDRLGDSVGSNTAIIVASNTGTFDGSQSNSVTGINVKLHGPVSGEDTIFLDLFSGRVRRRTTDLHIPVTVETEGRPPLQDVLDVRRTMALDESNAVRLRD